MKIPLLTAGCVLAAIAAPICAPTRARAADDGDQHPEIVVTAQAQMQTPPQTHGARIDNSPATHVTIDAATIAVTVNAVSVEDTLKYAPSLVVRKRSIGDNFAPIATRTSGLGSSARSLVYADGALLSALIANNNGNGSPKWNLVAPEEVERIEVLYGPFSAAYAGNSIGAVVNITTRMPDRLEAQATMLFNQQWHRQYASALSLPTGQGSASIGDRIEHFAFFLSATHTVSNAQPIAYVTAASAPAGASGAIPTLNRTGAPIVVLGAGDIDHHVEDTIKLKLAYDLSGVVRASYTVGLFLDSTTARLDNYLRDAAGNPVTTSGFNAGLYRRSQRHWSHAVALDGQGRALDWQVVGTLYDYARDRQSSPTGALPAAYAGGAGSVQSQDGTGWWTLDARAAWRSGAVDAAGIAGNVLSLGAHLDRYQLRTQTYASADWIAGNLGTRSAAALGKTRTGAVWAQDAARIAPGLVLTLGGRMEWWRAWGGFNQTSAAVPGIAQPTRTATGFSPKATLAWTPAPAWSVKASFGQAWRFATVGELYQATTVGTVLANPNPNLRPERARSGELAFEWHDRRGMVRVSLFDEVVKDALISQNPPASSGVTTSFVQNVERTRARGVELVVERRDVVPRVDLSASVTYADAVTSKDTAFPAAVGKLLPSVPRWKGNAVVTWRALPRLSLSAALRFSSRNYASLDNSDVFADTYQGFDRFLVVDLRGTFRLSDRLDAALGIDNVNNDRYFLFHPFPQHSLTASLHWKL